MKTLFTLLISVTLISFTTDQIVPRHNVFFPWNSSELKGTSAAVVESVYKKIASGKKVRFGIKGPISNVHNTTEKNRINSERANSIVALIEQIKSEDDVVEVVTIAPLYGPSNTDRGMTSPIELEVLVAKAQGWIEPDFMSIDDYLPLDVQHFTINPKEDNRLVGEQGTVINIPAFCLQLGNGSVPSEMNVELTEVYGNGQLVQANLHTASGGRMLRSGGTIHLDASTNGKPAQVASGKHLDLEFPHGEDVAENMEVFNGRVDRGGNFDWVPKAGILQLGSRIRETFYINEVEVSKEEYLETIQAWENRKAERERDEAIAEQVASNETAMDAYLLQSDDLGWINCDEFYDVENKTDVIVYVDTTFQPSVRMVFDNISSVMEGDYNQRNGIVTFSDVPVGESVQLVGYSIMDGNAFMANRSFVVNNDLKMDLALTATTKQQMQAELASLN